MIHYANGVKHRTSERIKSLILTGAKHQTNYKQHGGSGEKYARVLTVRLHLLPFTRVRYSYAHTRTQARTTYPHLYPYPCRTRTHTCTHLTVPVPVPYRTTVPKHTHRTDLPYRTHPWVPDRAFLLKIAKSFH